MGSDILKIGVLGAADIAVNRVIPSLRRSKKVRVHAIASRTKKKSREWAKKLEIDHSFGSYEELLDNSRVDAVYVPLPNSLHCEWTLKALQKGKHVLCEKPLATTSDEVIQMIKLAREKKLVLMEGFMYRFHPRNLSVMEMVRGGEIGRIRAVESAFSYVLDNPESYLMNRELGGGALYDVGCYCVNVSRMVAGGEATQVYGIMNSTKTNVDDTFAGVIKFINGVISSFHVSMIEEPRFYYRVIGEEGLIEVPWAFVSFGKTAHIILQKKEKQKKVEFKGVDEYRLEFEHFAEAVLQNKPLQFDIEDSLKNAYVLEGLIKSAQKGMPLKV
jgi:predicted dehydrogenase